MRFVHLVKINDPLNPLIEPLTREQVWNGLVLRAEEPQAFIPHLVSARIVARIDHCVARELDFGSFKVRDRVTLEPMRRIVISTEASDDRAAGSLIMTIEEPGAEQLQLRFEYDLARVHHDDAASEAMYDHFIKSAYTEADIDCVRIIRRHAAM